MLGNIKNWMNWPNTGVKNINEFGNYVKANWLSLVILLVVVLVATWVVLKIIGFIVGIFKSNN